MPAKGVRLTDEQKAERLRKMSENKTPPPAGSIPNLNDVAADRLNLERVENGTGAMLPSEVAAMRARIAELERMNQPEPVTTAGLAAPAPASTHAPSIDQLTDAHTKAMQDKALSLLKEAGYQIKAPAVSVYQQSASDLYGVTPEPGWWYCPVEQHPENWNLPGLGEFEKMEVKGYVLANNIPQGISGSAIISKNFRVYKIQLEKFKAMEKEAWDEDARRRNVKLPDEDERVAATWNTNRAVTKSYS